MYSFDFELPGEPAQIAPFRTQKPQKNGNYFFDPNSFTENGTDIHSPPCVRAPCSNAMSNRCWATLGTAPRTICCGPQYQQHGFCHPEDYRAVGETRHIDFRAEFFNIFNHTQFFNPDGNTSDGAQFGQRHAGPRSTVDAVCVEVLLLDRK